MLLLILSLSLASELYFSGFTSGVTTVKDGKILRLEIALGNSATNNSSSIWISPYSFWTMPPVAKMKLDPIQGSPPLKVNFSALDSYDPDGGRLWYNWTYEIPNGAYGNAKNETSQDATFTEVYNTYGLYSVWLTVTDDEGKNDTTEGSIAVCNGGDCTDPAIASTNIHLKKSVLFDGENQSAQITIDNLGDKNQKPVIIEVYDTGKLIKTETIPPDDLTKCEKRGTYTFVVNWTVNYIGHPKHNITVMIDPHNSVPECDETNNQASKSFKVYYGPICSISTDRKEIAAKNCSTYWERVCSQKGMKIKPHCCKNNQCSKSCDTSTKVNAKVLDEDGNVLSGSTSTTLGTLSWSWNSTNKEEWDGSGDFSSNDAGIATLALSSLTEHGGCYAHTKVKVTQTGHEYDWSDLEISNIEAIPTPIAGTPSNVYVTLKNNGVIGTGNITMKIIIMGDNDQLNKQIKMNTSIPPQGTKRILVYKNWRVNNKGRYDVTAVAFPTTKEDYDVSNNIKRITFDVNRGIHVSGQTSVPEYPSVIFVLAIIGAFIIAAELTKH